MITMSYDPASDAVYVTFPGGEQRRPSRSRRLDDFRGVDLDADGEPIGVEFLFVGEAGVNLAGVPRADELAEFFAGVRHFDVHRSVGWLGSTRRRLGLTQAQLAAELGVAANTLAQWERGDKPIGNPRLVQLALETIARRHDERRAPTRLYPQPAQRVAEDSAETYGATPRRRPPAARPG